MIASEEKLTCTISSQCAVHVKDLKGFGHGRRGLGQAIGCDFCADDGGKVRRAVGAKAAVRSRLLVVAAPVHHVPDDSAKGMFGARRQGRVLWKGVDEEALSRRGSGDIPCSEKALQSHMHDGHLWGDQKSKDCVFAF